MHSFTRRSYEKELLDRDDIPFADIQRNMEELSLINRHLGGHRITLEGFRSLSKNRTHLHVVEIGSGGGDNLLMLKNWSRQQQVPLKLTGIDINAECVLYARQLPANKGIDFIHADYRHVHFENQPDIIFSSLFCHHFDEQALVFMLHWMRSHAATGFFINDLHRHPLAYHSIRLLTQLFSRSYLVKNDAPLSVKRGFVRADWEQLFRDAGISSYHIQWKWAFRWLVSASNS